jgi:hypothetical protein
VSKKLLVYAEQDTATGIWTIDCPELWVIGAQAGGSLSEAVASVIIPGEDDELEIRDMGGAWPIEYNGQARG